MQPFFLADGQRACRWQELGEAVPEAAALSQPPMSFVRFAHFRGKRVKRERGSAHGGCR
jgi:hypothetical protein